MARKPCITMLLNWQSDGLQNRRLWVRFPLPLLNKTPDSFESGVFLFLRCQNSVKLKEEEEDFYPQMKRIRKSITIDLRVLDWFCRSGEMCWESGNILSYNSGDII